MSRLATEGSAPYLKRMNPRDNLYRDLTPERAVELTQNAIGKCDDGELYLQYGVHESFAFDDGRLKVADYGTNRGFGLRGVSGETTGFAHADEITEPAIRRAAETMRLLDPATAQSEAPRRSNTRLYTDSDPLGLVPFVDKVALMERIDAAARARDPRVVQVSASLSGSWQVIDIVRADGFVAHDIRPLVRLNVGVVVEANGRRESGNFGLGGRYLYERLFEEDVWNRAIDEALAQALVNLEFGRRARWRNARAAWPRLVRRAASRSGRSRS